LTPRRLASLLVIWISLFSVAVPAIACAAAVQHGDCCPDEGTPPCGECPDKAPTSKDSPDHCLAAPGSVTTSGVVSEPARRLVTADIEPAACLPALPELRSINPSAEPIRHRWRQPRGDLETPTYLITGRLRL
jgi:hypothetical protein